MSEETFGVTKVAFKIKIGEMLLDAGVITAKQLDHVLKVQNEMAVKGNPRILGDLANDVLGISPKTIEDVFARYLILYISQNLNELIVGDQTLADRIGDRDHFIEKLDFFIPRWEVFPEGKNRLIKAEMTLVITTCDDKTIDISLPFQYIIEDQLADIDLPAAVESIKKKLAEPGGGISVEELGRIGIFLPLTNRPSKILFVDDEKEQRELMKQILVRMGYSVKLADGAEMALKLLGKEEFPLIILDLFMPGMDGRGLCAKIKSISPGSVVYAMSGYIHTFGTESIEEAGFDGYLYKPVGMSVLKSAIEKALVPK